MESSRLLYEVCGLGIISQMLTTDLDAIPRCLAHIVHLAAKHIVQAFSQDSPLMESNFPLEALPTDINENSETSHASGDTLGYQDVDVMGHC
jgi:hypothetical protein